MLTEEDKFSFEEKPMSTTPEPSIFEAVSQEKVKTEIVTIGRSRTNDIVIDDDLVSRYHCRIEMMGDYCCIFNLSLYGDTFLNEVRIRDKAFLRRGDIIRIGNTLIGINIGEDDDPITKSDLVCSSYNWGPPLNIYPKGMFYDGVELTDRYKAVIDEVEKKLERRLRFNPRYGRLGFCHIYWEKKKELLKRKYGIIWRSPGELNPNVMFD